LAIIAGCKTRKNAMTDNSMPMMNSSKITPNSASDEISSE
jgi:hypothetical protein